MNYFQELIGRLGDEAAAVLFNSTPTVTKSWRLGKRYPRRSKAIEIIAIMKNHQDGPIDWSDIYGEPES